MTTDLIGTWKAGRLRPRNQGGGELIPTWQVGHEQPRDQDLKRFAEHGYSKNSLIYACIREKATSFASLGVPNIIRADGHVVEGQESIRRVRTLLENPNTYQDGADFAEMLKTHDDAAGNVYIEMIPVSDDRERRREFAGYPVQELQLIRPDYVTIEPGASREQDVFMVTIEGQVRKRIPRANMIHLKRQHLTNDFYGLSPIALIVREGSIDLEMSDFELSFYRNAGVPMGILNVKGVEVQEANEIKSKFRQAYNGVKHWFELLVLNSEEATYQQLGVVQKDMELDSTRGLAESRICMVFGVPPIVVGARFAIATGGQNANYEQHHFAFWSETMVPESERIARAFTKFLLPRFATTRDRGAYLQYDYTQVRVLQEDLSRKLREVVRMINTGAIMVSTAFQIVGLPAPPNSDFYLRSGNQAAIDAEGNVIVAAQPAGGSGEPDADNPLEGAARLDPGAVVREAERTLSIFDRSNGWH